MHVISTTVSFYTSKQTGKRAHCTIVKFTLKKKQLVLVYTVQAIFTCCIPDGEGNY